jgi:isopropylmalate/homocitrate/citramalate synthase
MQSLPIKIVDETLRDGEQQAGVFFSYDDKRELAHQIAAAGVHYVDIMPLIDSSEEELVSTLVGEGLEHIILPAVMTGKRFIDHAKTCGVKRITLFHAVSDRLMFLRDNDARRSPLLQNRTVDDCLPPTVISRVRGNAFDKIMDNLRYATSRAVGLECDFAAEDASRADFDFLTHCVNNFRPYIGHFMLCDTVGVLSPERTHRWIYDVMQATDEAPVAVHFHNDLGMAVENTIQAVIAGASMISGTFCGIGERAGNAALEQVLHGLRVRFGAEVDGVDYDALDEIAARVKSLGGMPAKPYSKEARRHETGIHVNSILRDPRSYSNFRFEEPEVWFGKCSGASNFQYLFENKLNRPLGQEAYNAMRVRIKALSIKEQRCFSAAEVVRLFEEGRLDGAESVAVPDTNGAVPHPAVERHAAPAEPPLRKERTRPDAVQDAPPFQASIDGSGVQHGAFAHN